MLLMFIKMMIGISAYTMYASKTVGWEVLGLEYIISLIATISILFWTIIAIVELAA